MKRPSPGYLILEQALRGWAAARADVHALVVIGSRARTERPADAFSDLDAVVFTDDWHPYCAPGRWQEDLLAAFQIPTWFTAYQPIDRETPEWEIVLRGGLKVDLVFLPNRSPLGRSAPLSEMMALSPVSFVFQLPFRVLIDKTLPFHGVQADAPLPQPEAAGLPGQFEFENSLAGVLLELVRAVRLSARGELWRAAKAINEELRPSLLALLEWQATARRGRGVEVWPYGRFLEEWADPRALAAIPATYTNSSPISTIAAVHAILDLLHWLGPETAGLLGLEYPHERLRPAVQWLRQAAGQPAYRGLQGIH